jgi:hypothetical protein
LQSGREQGTHCLTQRTIFNCTVVRMYLRAKIGFSLHF